MGEAIRKLGNTEVGTLAGIFAECMTGSQMNGIFQECGVRDTSNESTKWIEGNVERNNAYGQKCNGT